MDILQFVNSVRTVANDKAAVLAVLSRGKSSNGYFYECARALRKALKGIEKASPLTEEDIDFTIQQAVNAATDPTTVWYKMGGNGAFSCCSDACRAIVSYVQDVSTSPLRYKINKALQLGEGHHVKGFTEQDSEVLKHAFGGEWKPFENDRQMVVKLIALIEDPCHLPIAQTEEQEEQSVRKYVKDPVYENEVIKPSNATDSRPRFGYARDAKCLTDGLIPAGEIEVEDGGPGSGNWGHKGVRGQWGGSAKGGGKHNRSAQSGGLYGGNTSKQWGDGEARGFVTAKSDWVNGLKGTSNHKADKFVRKWASEPPKNEAARKHYDPVDSAQKNVMENGSLQDRKQMIDLKKEARLWNERGSAFIKNLSEDEQAALRKITGWRDIANHKKGEPDHEETCDFGDMTDQQKAYVLDLMNKAMDGSTSGAKGHTAGIEMPQGIRKQVQQDKQSAEQKAKKEEQRKAKEQAEKKAKQEAEKKAKQEAERKAKEEAERKAKEEAERKAKQQAAKKAKEESERKAKEEAQQKAKQGEAEKPFATALQQRRSERFKEAAKAAESAKTMSELMRAARTAGFVGDLRPHKSLQSAVSQVKTVMDLASKIPAIANSFTGFSKPETRWPKYIKDQIGASDAVTVTYTDGTTQYFSGKTGTLSKEQFQLRDETHRMYGGFVKLDPGYDAQAVTATHEFGHILSNEMSRKGFNQKMFIQELNKSLWGSEFPKREIQAEICLYAASTDKRGNHKDGQQFAELFNEAVMSSNPRKPAVEFKKRLVAEMKRLGIEQHLFTD